MSDFVLVVDTDAEALAETRRLVESTGVSSRGATDVLELEEALSSGSPPVIVIEADLEGADGFELAAGLVDPPLGGPSPTVLVVSRRLTGGEPRERARESGAYLFLELPAGNETLANAVRHFASAHENAAKGDEDSESPGEHDPLSHTEPSSNAPPAGGPEPGGSTGGSGWTPEGDLGSGGDDGPGLDLDLGLGGLAGPDPGSTEPERGGSGSPEALAPAESPLGPCLPEQDSEAMPATEPTIGTATAVLTPPVIEESESLAPPPDEIETPLDLTPAVELPAPQGEGEHEAAGDVPSEPGTSSDAIVPPVDLTPAVELPGVTPGEAPAETPSEVDSWIDAAFEDIASGGRAPTPGPAPEKTESAPSPAPTTPPPAPRLDGGAGAPESVADLRPTETIAPTAPRRENPAVATTAPISVMRAPAPRDGSSGRERPAAGAGRPAQASLGPDLATRAAPPRPDRSFDMHPPTGGFGSPVAAHRSGSPFLRTVATLAALVGAVGLIVVGLRSGPDADGRELSSAALSTVPEPAPSFERSVPDDPPPLVLPNEEVADREPTPSSDRTDASGESPEQEVDRGTESSADRVDRPAAETPTAPAEATETSVEAPAPDRTSDAPPVVTQDGDDGPFPFEETDRGAPPSRATALPLTPSPPVRTAPKVVPESRVAPIYPAEASRAGVGGTVVVSATVLEDGTVADATVVEQPEGGEALGRAAVAALVQWRYEPATSGGRPVEHALRVTFDFGR